MKYIEYRDIQDTGNWGIQGTAKDICTRYRELRKTWQRKQRDTGIQGTEGYCLWNMIQGTRDIFRIQGYSAINDTELQDTSYRIQETEQGYWNKRDRQYSFMQPYSLYNINYLNLINNYFSLCVMFIVCQLEELVLESQVLELMNFSVLNWQNFGNQMLSKTLCF